MKTTFNTNSTGLPQGVSDGAETQRTNAGRRGFSLIEMIGVLAVLAISAAMLLPVLTSTAASTAESQESALLQSFATALQLNIQRNHVIPSVTNWVSIVATELGMSSNAVAFNSVGQPRYLLIDSNGFGALTLPYVEPPTGTNSTMLTNSTPPRFIFLSSLGQPVPATVLGTNMMPLSTDFNGLWATAAGSIPQTVPWTTWTGLGSDLTVQRLDLAYVFAHIILSNTDPTNATFSVNGSAPINIPGVAATNNISGTNVMNAYFLTATLLNLYMAGTNLEASQVINHDCSWVYSGGGWRNAPAPAPAALATNAISGSSGSAGGSGSVSVGGCVDNDPGDCCHQFNCQSFCTNSSNPWTGGNPNNVCNDFTNYMCCYQAYANSNFTNRTCRTALQNCCNQLNNDCGSLCNYNNY